MSDQTHKGVSESLKDKIERLREQSRQLVRRLLEVDTQGDPDKRAEMVKEITGRMRTLTTALRCLGALNEVASTQDAQVAREHRTP